MRIINTASGMTSLLLGRLGENERTQFVFDVSDWLEEYPGATIGLYNQLPHSSDSYPVVISQPADGKVTWAVGATELQEPGWGQCELVAVDSETVVKGHIWKTHILEALDGAGDAPDPWESWMTEFTELKGEAEDAAEAAEDSAEDAADSAEDAEAWAVGQRGGVDVGESDPTYENNAKYYAENAAEAAEAAAQALIDDTAGSGDTDKVWSADKLAEEFESVLTEEMLKSTTPSSRTSGSIATTSGRQYAVHPDAEGKLSVNVPWTDEKNVMPYVSSVSSSGQSGNIKTFNVVFPGFTYRDGSSFEIVLGSSVSLNSGDSLYISINGSSKALTYIGTNPIEAGVYWVTCKNSQYTMRKNGIDTAVNGINVSTAAGKGVSTSMPSSPTDDTVPTAKAVKDYVDGAIPDISGKADKVASATSGNFAALDSNGNLVDSGHKHSDYLTSHQDISGKLDKTDFYATEMPVSSTDSTKVSEKLTDLNGALSNKIDEPETAGTAGQVLSLDSNLDPVWTTPASGSDDNKAPVIIDSASGAIASFPDGADNLPLQNLTVGIEPVQDLHGQDNPYPAGGGKNLVNVDDITGVTSQTEIGGTFTLPAGTYVLSAYISNSGSASVALRISKSDNTMIGTTGYSASTLTRQSKSFTLEESTTCKLSVVGSASGYNGSVSKVQIETGTSPTDYAPYANICPITGWTGCNVSRTGTNLLSYTGKISSSEPTESPLEIALHIPTTITFSMYATSDYANSSNYWLVYIEKKDGTKTYITPTAGQRTTKTITGSAENPFIKIYIRRTGITAGNCYNLMIEASDSASDFEPYSGTTIPVTFPEEAGTVYGGSLNVLTGKLTKTWENIASYDGETLPGEWISDRDVYAEGTTPTTGAQVVYELAEPVEYTLTAQQINSLLGQNNIFADTGNSSVTYRADTELFVQKSLPSVPVQDVQINGTSILSQGVANVPVASDSALGAVKLSDSYGIWKSSGNHLTTQKAPSNNVKEGTDQYKPIVPYNQHESVFYGLAKASGDTSQSSSSNAVGTYTEDAKSSIHQMLDAPVSVSGSTPSITAKAGVRYICGECATLSITAPASGCIDVVFDSGSTATVLTVTSAKTGVTAIEWADGFNPNAIATNATYWLKIIDGEYGVATAWGVQSGGGTIGDDLFELIETITLTEDTNVIERTQTPLGQSYNFHDVILMINAPAYSKGVDATISFSGDYGAIYQITNWSNTINTSARKSFISFERIAENLFRSFRNSGQQWVYGGATCELTTNQHANNQSDAIIKIKYGANNSTNMVPSGTVIYIYAKWAN